MDHLKAIILDSEAKHECMIDGACMWDRGLEARFISPHRKKEKKTAFHSLFENHQFYGMKALMINFTVVILGTQLSCTLEDQLY